MAIEILVVDDSAVMRMVIEKTISICRFEDADVQVYEASNGKEGLSLLDNHPVDLLLIDLNMPVMDGMKMLSEIRKRENNQDLPVLVVSAESNEARIKEIERQGAVFIHKPFTPEKLRGEMLRIMKREGIAPACEGKE